MQILMRFLLMFGAMVAMEIAALADGYPFNSETQEVYSDTLRLRLDHAQIEMLSRRSSVTLSEDQLKLVRFYYPKAVRTQHVITATFNDSVEGLSDKDAYIFWVTAEEIAITVDNKVLADEALRNSALTAEFEERKDAVRISPDGVIYVSGKEASLASLLEMITAWGKGEKAGWLFEVAVAPPYPGSGQKTAANEDATEGAKVKRSAAEVFEELVKHGKACGVEVGKSW